jgi:subtilisin family serine protease
VVSIIPILGFLLCISPAISEVEVSDSLHSALSSGAKQITVIARFRSLDKFKILGEKSRSEIQRHKMQVSAESQAEFFSMLQTRKQNNGDLIESYPLWVNNSVIITASTAFIRKLLQRKDILRLTLDREVHLEKPIKPSGSPSRDSADYTYGLLKVRAPEVWETFGIEGEGVTVGLLDTGWADHPELRGRVILSKDFVSDYHYNQPNDGNGHGSHCLGTIGGGSLGGKSIGVAPKVKFIVGKIFSDSGSTSLVKIMRAMQWIADPDGNPDTVDHPRVISNSWGGGQGSQEAEQEMWDIVTTWRELGIVPVFAAGNSGDDEDTVGTPGGYPHAFAIGATDDEDAIAYFSSRGPITWGDQQYVKPDVSAPGVDILSLNKDSGYTLMSGTSMATPHVAGVVALILQANPDLSVSDIEGILRDTAIDQGEPGMDNDYGQGRVDAFAAVSAALNGGMLELQISADNYEALVKIQPGGYGYRTRGGKLKTVLPHGSYTVEISAFGHLAKTIQVQVKKKETLHRAVNLQKNARFQIGFDLRSSAGLSLGGAVSFPDSPLRGGSSESGLIQLSIPAGSYQGLAKVTGYRPHSFDFSVSSNAVLGIEMEKLPDVLLVDDDKGRSFETYYELALAQNDISYDLVEYGAEDVMGYETVIWFTGDDHAANMIKEREQAMLTTYIESGGRLIVSGQDMGYGMNQLDFYQEVLGANYLEDVSKVKTIAGQGLRFQLDGEDSAKNQKWPDVFEINAKAQDTASVLLRYDGQGPAIILNTYGDGASIYLGFGFEGVTGGQIRSLLMKTLLDALKMDTSDRLRRMAWAYQNDPVLYRVLVDQFSLSTENVKDVREFLATVRLKSPYRAVLNSLRDFETEGELH